MIVKKGRSVKYGCSTRGTFHEHLRGTVAVGCEGGALIVQTPNAPALEVLQVRLQPKVDNVLREVLRIHTAGSAGLEVNRVEWRVNKG